MSERVYTGALHDFVDRLDQALRRQPASVTSWYRTPPRNARVGGVRHSRHLTGLAVDLVPDDWHDSDALVQALREAGLRAIRESDHVHAEYVMPPES